jgi:hypothetical protein
LKLRIIAGGDEEYSATIAYRGSFAVHHQAVGGNAPLGQVGLGSLKLAGIFRTTVAEE